MKVVEEFLERRFFDSFYKGLKKEDELLRNLCEKNGVLYKYQHNGIAFLYETTMVYVVLKQLMEDGFPLTADWECPYICNPSLKADLGLLNEAREVDSLVEFKIWTSEDGSEIRRDVEKYNNCAFEGNKYLCIVELNGGNISENAKFLLEENPEVELLYKDSFESLFKKNSEEALKYVFTHLYMLRMRK